MDQRFQHGLLNDIFRHGIASRKTTNHSIQVRKMLRDAIPEFLFPGH
jgi:hypothetical protein